MRFFTICLTAAAGILACSAHAAAKNDFINHQYASVVEISTGKVGGFTRNGVLEFRGIPYAATVAGQNRWELPQPPSPWEGILPAMHFPKACAQAARYNLTEQSDNEDCLYLNVSLPIPEGEITKQKRPVIVWIHGGAFVGGSSSLYRLDHLAQKTGAVVVSINYRLGVFGFMPHPGFDEEYNGGYALEDQRLAMRWVKDNVAAFGGDPDNITLAGESAGAASVCLHLISPETTEGLFHKAIVQSGACTFRLRNVEDHKNFGQKVAELAGCSDPKTALTCLRQKDVQTLIQAGDKASAGDLMAFAPVYGNKTVPLQGIDALSAGRFVKVPLLNGVTRDELSLYLGYDIQAGKSYDAGNYVQAIKEIYGENAEAVAREYPLENYSSVPSALSTLMTDFRPDLGINHCLAADTAKLISRSAPVYQWEFADRNTPVLGIAMPIQPDPGFSLGAAHSSELNAFFPNFSNTTSISGPDLPPRSQKMADQMLAMWASFIRTGQPRSQAISHWPTYGDSGLAVRFDPENIHAFKPVDDYKCSFWQSLYPAYFSK